MIPWVMALGLKSIQTTWNSLAHRIPQTKWQRKEMIHVFQMLLVQSGGRVPWLRIKIQPNMAYKVDPGVLKANYLLTQDNCGLESWFVHYPPSSKSWEQDYIIKNEKTWGPTTVDTLKLPQHLKFKKGQNSVEILPSLGINLGSVAAGFPREKEPKIVIIITTVVVSTVPILKCYKCFTENNIKSRVWVTTTHMHACTHTHARAQSKWEWAYLILGCWRDRFSKQTWTHQQLQHF